MCQLPLRCRISSSDVVWLHQVTIFHTALVRVLKCDNKQTVVKVCTQINMTGITLFYTSVRLVFFEARYMARRDSHVSGFTLANHRMLLLIVGQRGHKCSVLRYRIVLLSLFHAMKSIQSCHSLVGLHLIESSKRFQNWNLCMNVL